MNKQKRKELNEIFQREITRQYLVKRNIAMLNSRVGDSSKLLRMF